METRKVAGNVGDTKKQRGKISERKSYLENTLRGIDLRIIT